MTTTPTQTSRPERVPPQSVGSPISRRLFAVAVAGLLLTVGSIAIGGIPLLAGLGAASLLALGLLPGGSRRYLLRRAARVGGSVLVAMAIIWLLVHNYPDASRQDPTGVVPAMVRYVSWMGDLVAGEMGDTQYAETVEEGVSRTIPISMQLLIYSQVMALFIAIPGAIAGAQYRGRMVDLAFRAVGMLGLAVPMFVSGLMMMYFFGVGELRMFGLSWGVKVFPTGRYIPIAKGVWPHIESMILPSFTLALTTAATYLVLLRSEMLQQLLSEHVQLARSKGLPPSHIVRRHALRPAAPTLVAAVGAQSAMVLGNMLIVERIFLLPGFSDYVLIAIGRRDVTAIVGSLFVIAAILAVVNLFADAALLAVDPRLDR